MSDTDTSWTKCSGRGRASPRWTSLRGLSSLRRRAPTTARSPPCPRLPGRRSTWGGSRSFPFIISSQSFQLLRTWNSTWRIVPVRRQEKVSSVLIMCVRLHKLSINKNFLMAPSTDLVPTLELFLFPTLPCLVMSGMTTPPAGCFMPRWHVSRYKPFGAWFSADNWLLTNEYWVLISDFCLLTSDCWLLTTIY